MCTTLLGLLCSVAVAASPPAEPAPTLPREPALSDRDRAHWAFQKPRRLDPPAVKDAGWVKTPIDAFIRAAQEKAGLQPAPPLDRAGLLRRVTFDLIGLPPTPEELAAFLADTRPDAYERVVDRLLASPHFGEHWAQHWLDVVRYAESDGYEADTPRPHAWRYRDYVVRSFNRDLPYNRFVTEQIAGDLLAAAPHPRPLSPEGRGEKELPPHRRPLSPEGRGENAEADLLIAAGLHRCGPVHLTSGNIDPAVARQEVLTEITNGVATAFLGLTMGCARCHDHKFDPISLLDYYRLQAFFSTLQPKDVLLATDREKADYDRLQREREAVLAPLRKQIANLEAPYRAKIAAAKRAKLDAAYRDALDTPVNKRTPRQVQLAAHAQVLLKITWNEVVDALSPADRERRLALRRQLHEREASKPAPPAQAWTVADNGSPPGTPVLRRGDPKKPGALVAPAFPRVLAPLAPRGGWSTGFSRSSEDRKPAEAGTPTSPRGEGSKTVPGAPHPRLQLAEWLTQPDHPLTARVIVNRLWQHHFGRGLVDTPNDFGRHGSKPSHPELLDWLATELVRGGWSLKHLHRLMVLSNTYRQESRVPTTQAARQRLDPDNRLLSHMNRQRLSAEALRDSVLAVAGTLNRKLGGPVVRVPLEPEVYDLIFTEGDPDGLWPVTPDVREHTRRSLYLFAKRNVRQPVLEAFDQPDTLTSCPIRPISTFAPQALILLNGPLTQQQSQAFAVRLLRAASDRQGRIDLAFRLALSRPPRPDEAQLVKTFLREQAQLLDDRLRARLRVNVPERTPPDCDPAEAAALADFCLALFNRNEFLYIR